MNIVVYKDPNHPPKPPVECPRPQKSQHEPYVNPMNGEPVRSGEEYITGPLRLVFVYRTEEKTRWGFYYQSLFDEQYLHAREHEKENDDGYRAISTNTEAVSEEEVLAQFMSREKVVWVDKEYDRWTSISQAARDIIEDNTLFIKTKIGPGMFFCPYLDDVPILPPSEKTLKAFSPSESKPPKDFFV